MYSCKLGFKLDCFPVVRREALAQLNAPGIKGDLQAQQEFRDNEKDPGNDQKQEDTSKTEEDTRVEEKVTSSTKSREGTLSSESDVEIVLEEKFAGTKCRASCLNLYSLFTCKFQFISNMQMGNRTCVLRHQKWSEELFLDKQLP